MVKIPTYSRKVNMKAYQGLLAEASKADVLKSRQAFDLCLKGPQLRALEKLCGPEISPNQEDASREIMGSYPSDNEAFFHF